MYTEKRRAELQQQTEKEREKMKNIEKKYAVLGWFEDDEEWGIYEDGTREECLDYVRNEFGGDPLGDDIWIVRADIAQKIIDNSDTLTDEEISLLPLSLIACM